MFYDKQSKKEQEDYKNMLSIIGSYSLLFSESDVPYLYYRCHENIFCKYFNADNLSREDSSADAKKNKIGIGLKTWVGNDDQKVAEFNKLRPTYAKLEGLELVKKIAEYRNARIQFTKNSHGLQEMIYHIIKRKPGVMKIVEHTFDEIDIDNIKLLNNSKAKENNIYFTDGKHTYHFSLSKNTLYMIFKDLVEMDEIPIDILADPYRELEKINEKNEKSISAVSMEKCATSGATPFTVNTSHKLQLCLRLYSVSQGKKFVAEKSGLNQWNACGRKRNPNELYIPYPSDDRKRIIDFFPNREECFELLLPDGQVISAKVCQDSGKAIMSNPNKVLGEWLLRKVFCLKEGELLTYDTLLKCNVDSVIFTKLGDLKYSIDFATLGTYEEFYGIE